jgi:hypothetical protein
VVTAPLFGWAYDRGDTFSTVLTATSESKILSDSLDDRLGVRLNVILTQSEPPHRSITTEITGIDIVSGTMTVADAPGWSGATAVSPMAATFTPTGILGTVQAPVVAPLREPTRVSGTGGDPTINANFAEIVTTLNAVIASLRDAKLMA